MTGGTAWLEVGEFIAHPYKLPILLNYPELPTDSSRAVVFPALSTHEELSDDICFAVATRDSGFSAIRCFQHQCNRPPADAH